MRPRLLRIRNPAIQYHNVDGTPHLNVLLSFAQFEREVTGERIRDKIAASKAKGMWMGGWVPIGYDRKDRSLTINESEAKTVRTIFELYLKFGSTRKVKAELDRLKIKTKKYVAVTGRQLGGLPFAIGHLYYLLSNPLYIGQIRHKEMSRRTTSTYHRSRRLGPSAITNAAQPYFE
jgi:hypothetical protein